MAQPQVLTTATLPAEFRKLEKVHVTAPGAHIGGSYQTLLDVKNGWDITIRPDIQGVIAVHRTGEYWIPFGAIRNGTLLK